VLGSKALENSAAFICRYASIASSRDWTSELDSVDGHVWFLGNELVHVDMLDACAGVRKGCEDW
jgi:hypothetical protein